jgi:hypothetical protein
MVGQFSVEVNRKDAPGLCRGPLLPSSKPAKMRAFYSGVDNMSVCAERDRLWTEFEAASNACLATLNGTTLRAYRTDMQAARMVDVARSELASARSDLRRHCELCGCSPDWLKALDRTA